MSVSGVDDIGEAFVGDRATAPDNEALLRDYRKMLLLRRFEEKAGQLFAMGQIANAGRLSVGQEASRIGLCRALTRGDPLLCGEHALSWMLALGMDPLRIMVGLLGQNGGYADDKGGPLRMISAEHGFHGGQEQCGAQVPAAVGMALANQAREVGVVTWVCMDASSVERAPVRAAVRVARDRALRICFVLQGTIVGDGSVSKASAEVMTSLGVSLQSVRAIDTQGVRAVAAKARRQIVENEAPVAIELLTYPFQGHAARGVGSDGCSLAKSETDPIAKARRVLIERVGLEDDDICALDDAVRNEVAVIVEQARAAS